MCVANIMFGSELFLAIRPGFCFTTTLFIEICFIS